MLSPNTLPEARHPASARTAGSVRALEASDVGEVARLFQKTFIDARTPAPAGLAQCLDEIFLRHRWQSDDVRSQVFIDDDAQLKGFVGVLPLRLQHRNKPMLAAVLGSLMAEGREVNPLIGARLLRAALQGGQDISISESANPLTQKMWELVGGTTLANYSLNWIRVFRPMALPFSLAAGRHAGLARAGATLVSPVDLVLNKMRSNPFASASLPEPALPDEEVSADEFAEALPALTERYALRPDWDSATLRWQLHHAAVKERFGNLRCYLLRKGNRTVGGYLYYGRPGGIGFVLQTVALPKHEFAVISSMLSRAASGGCTAVRGRAQPEFLDALMRHHALMFHRSSMVVHAKDTGLLTTLRAGDGLITGLAGETWIRLIGGAFT